MELLKNKYPSELSVGEKQRTAFVRAIVSKPEILLADEPTGNLDSTTSLQIIQTLADLNKNHGLSVMMISHEECLLNEFADHIIRLRDGKIVDEDTE